MDHLATPDRLSLLVIVRHIVYEMVDKNKIYKKKKQYDNILKCLNDNLCA